MPVVPLWFNGVWAQMNTTFWNNWPCSADTCNHWLPASWRGYWNMTAIKMLCELEPVTGD
jgi:peptide/nickel transport system substrate-binding protein